METAPDLIPTRVVCEITGLHYSTISRMVKDGRLKTAMRVSDGPGGAMLFDRADIEAFAAALKEAS